MIVCKVCGNRNNDQEEFCTNCGRYLAWSGEHVDVAPEAEPELVVEDALVEARPQGFFRRVAVRLGLISPPAASPVAGAAGVPPGVAVQPEPEQADGVRVLGALPPAAAVGLVAAPAGRLGTGGALAAAPGRGDSVLVVSEVVGGEASRGESSLPVALAGSPGNGASGPGVGVMRPRRPGESLPQLPVLPPLPGREPPPSDRATVPRRPTEAAAKARPRRARAGAVAGLPELPTTPSPGDVFCPRCGQFNSPSRVYCRRCGLELGARSVAGDEIGYEPLTWWQRHLHQDVRVVGAGQRPGRWGKIVSGKGSQGRGMRIAVRVGSVLIAASLVLTFIGPYAPRLQSWYVNTYHSAYNYLNAREVGVSAVAAGATSSAPLHPAFLAVDGGSNTWWQSATVPLPPPAKPGKPAAKAAAGSHATSSSLAPTSSTVAATPGKPAAPRLKVFVARPGTAGTRRTYVPPPVEPPVPGVGQVLTISFSPATSLNRIAWLSGAAGALPMFDSIGRPHKVLVELSGQQVVENLADTPSLQTFKVAAKNVLTVRFEILSVYPGRVRGVAITEIEFFHRS